MSLEVELKFAVVSDTQLLERLALLGCRWEEPVAQDDVYLAHPARDFRQTDEAFRVRRSGDDICLTYKGPKLDTHTKTRREIELPIGGPLAEILAMFELLGFRQVRTVSKQRAPGQLTWRNAEVTLALDDVAGLGRFIELEMIADDDDLPRVRELILSLAQELELHEPERRGYLQMLLSLERSGKATENDVN